MATTTTLYVYNADTREVVARIHGRSNEECEEAARKLGYDQDEHGGTYTPAFGTNDGLIDCRDAEDIDAAGEADDRAVVARTEIAALDAQVADLQRRRLEIACKADLSDEQTCALLGISRRQLFRELDASGLDRHGRLHGWIDLPCGGEVRCEHGKPVRVSDGVKDGDEEAGLVGTGAEQIRVAIEQLCGYHVRLGDWGCAAGEPDATASVTVVES
jgi:hypothetical protein